MNVVDVIKENYKYRIINLLTSIWFALREAGYNMIGPEDFTGEEYCWVIFCDGDNGRPPNFDVSITIVESEVRDGEDENGVNFMLDITDNGGGIIGGLCPYNYTERVWVDARDLDAVEQRWELFESACDVDAIVESVEDYYRK